MKAKYAIPLGFIGVILAGAGLFSLPVSGGLGFMDALFTSCSAVCVTGLSTIDPVPALTIFGQTVLMVLVQIGGVGIMTFGTFILVLAGKRLPIDQEFALSNAYGVNGVKGFRGLVVWVVVSMLVIEGLGAWALNAVLNDPYRACFFSIMSFCNAGFTLDPGGVSSSLVDKPLAILVMSILMILGGLGFMVLYNICTIKFWHRSLRRQGRLSLHTRVVVWTTVAFVLVSFLVFLAAECNGVLAQMPWVERLSIALFQAVTPRTSGFTLVPLESMHPFTRFFSELLMFIGAAPGSTGGGIKITTFVVFLYTVHSYCHRRRDVVLSKRTIPPEVIRESLIITFTFLFCIALTVATLLVTENGRTGMDFESLLFESVSAVATTGLSVGDTTRSLSSAGQFVIMLAMFVGRLGALTIVLMIAGDDEPETIRYPKEDILVG